MATAEKTVPPLTHAPDAIRGWVALVVAALAMVATLPGRTHGLGLITERTDALWQERGMAVDSRLGNGELALRA